MDIICMEAYFVSHLGLGDNLYCNGATRYLTQFYTRVYFLCFDKYLDNVTSFFADNNKIVCVPVSHEQFSKGNPPPNWETIRDILHDKYKNNDIFICGQAIVPFFPSKITNPSFLQRDTYDKDYSLTLDTIDDYRYRFIREMYEHTQLNIGVMIDFWKLPDTHESRSMYESVREYRIVFLQTISSNGKILPVKNVLRRYLHDKNTILLFNDYNIYDTIENGDPDVEEKKKLANVFVKNKLVFYLDTIKNASEIYLIDSCFTGIILPLQKKGLLKAKTIRLIMRGDVEKYEL